MAMANPDSGSCNIALSKEPVFTITDIIFGQEIGKFLYGTVRVAKHKCEETKLYAVKTYNVNDLEADDFALLEKEVSNMKMLKHANILSITASLVSVNKIHIISPLMPMRSVSKIIQSDSLRFRYGIPEEAIAAIVADVVQAIIYLHQRQLVHRSIKSSHILLNECGSAVITGFRFMVQKTPKVPLHIDDLDKMTHNLHWLSPEILNQDCGGYTENSDIYSLGMTILEMGNGIAALDTNTPSMMFLKKVGCPSPSLMDMHNSYEQEMEKFESGHRGGGDADNQGPEMKRTSSKSEDKRRDDAFKSKEYGTEIKAFLEFCLIKEREYRPIINELKKHRFLKTCAKTTRSQLISLLGNPVRFEIEAQMPATPDVSNIIWDFDEIDLKE